MFHRNTDKLEGYNYLLLKHIFKEFMFHCLKFRTKRSLSWLTVMSRYGSYKYCSAVYSNEQVNTKCTLNAIRFLQTSSMYLSIIQRLYFASVLWQNVSSVKFIMSFAVQKINLHIQG